MSLASEWKKEIADMSPSKDKLININKSPRSPRSIRRHSSSRLKKGKSSSSSWAEFTRTCSNQPYLSFIVVFCAFYLLGWFIILRLLSSVEHDSYHKSSASLLHPHGEITHHLPQQIKKQIKELAHLQAILHDPAKLEKLKKAGNIHDLLAINAPKQEKVLNVAISILVTRDPGIKGGFLDSAGALVVSIEEAKSKHNINLIALVHKDVKYCVPILEAMGYEIRSYDTPFQIEDVRNKKIGEEMKTDGCCGILETLKLWAWTWDEFDMVLSIDADIHFHRNFDELFAMNTTLGWTHGATADKNQELMNGGYLLVKPNKKHFDDMVELLKEGDFRDGSAWKGSGVGWVYGGRTIQGIVPYYYLKVAVGDETEFPRCKYNNMVEIEKCRKWEFKDVTSNHFTWCQKPWYCITKQGQKLCDDFRESWWKRSHRFELEKLGMDKPREICVKRSDGYRFIEYYKSPKFLKYFKEHGYDTEPPKIPKEFFEKLKSKH